MGEVDNVVPFRPDDGRGNTENGTVHFERPSGAKFLGLGRMGNCPPVSGEIGLRPRGDGNAIRNRDRESHVIVWQFSRSGSQKFQSTKRQARCGIHNMNAFLIPAPSVARRTVCRKSAAADSLYDQDLPDTVFDCAQGVL